MWEVLTLMRVNPEADSGIETEGSRKQSGNNANGLPGSPPHLPRKVLALPWLYPSLRNVAKSSAAIGILNYQGHLSAALRGLCRQLLCVVQDATGRMGKLHWPQLVAVSGTGCLNQSKISILVNGHGKVRQAQPTWCSHVNLAGFFDEIYLQGRCQSHLLCAQVPSVSASSRWDQPELGQSSLDTSLAAGLRFQGGLDAEAVPDIYPQSMDLDALVRLSRVKGALGRLRQNNAGTGGWAA